MMRLERTSKQKRA
jgi:hypothetical protein